MLDWYSRKHSRVVRSTYAAELSSRLDATNQGTLIQTCFQEILRGTRTAREMIAENAGQEPAAVPMDDGGDAKAVFDSATADNIKTPDDKHLLLHARAMREFMEFGRVERLHWFGTDDMLPDGLTKGSIDREALITCCSKGTRSISHEEPIFKSFAKEETQ